jgi:predicted translin family RNA/ssDNA-binding protein
MPKLLIDKKEFEQLRRELESYDSRRDTIIKESRDITKLSKQAIYSLHRDELDVARKQLIDAEKVINKLLKDIRSDPTLRTGGFSGSLEEYTEAKAFLNFLESGTLLPKRDLKYVDAEEYLLGLCDLTGELMRYAVIRATKRDKKAVENARAIIDAVWGQLTLFDLRNSELRKKYDSIKYNLQKVENVLYDMALNPREVREE